VRVTNDVASSEISKVDRAALFMKGRRIGGASSATDLRGRGCVNTFGCVGRRSCAFSSHHAALMSLTMMPNWTREVHISQSDQFWTEP